MAWLDEADLHAAGRLPFALDETETPLELTRSALDELVKLVPSDASSWNRVALPSQAVQSEFARRSGAKYGISVAVRLAPRGAEVVVFALGRDQRCFSARDRDVLNVARPGLEHTLQLAEARQCLLLALASSPPPGTGVVLLDDYGEIQYSSPEAGRWLAEHFGAAEHPGWLPVPVASWLALPPRPALESVRYGRRLTIRLLPGEPHALLIEEEVAGFRARALEQLGLTGREREVLEAAPAVGAESELADELFLSLHAVRERLERVEDKLGVHTLPDAIAAARRASL
jgi:DNA-binding CsgD family transcriptional regulator